MAVVVSIIIGRFRETGRDRREKTKGNILAIPSYSRYSDPMKLTKDLVAASAIPLILSILEEGESYGYAIIQRVRDLSGGAIEWTDGMLYPVLHRLEAQGHIRSVWRTSDVGRRRKYYALR